MSSTYSIRESRWEQQMQFNRQSFFIKPTEEWIKPPGNLGKKKRKSQTVTKPNRCNRYKTFASQWYPSLPWNALTGVEVQVTAWKWQIHSISVWRACRATRDVNNWQGTLISDCNIWFTLIWKDSCIKEGIILISSRPLHIKLPIRLKVQQLTLIL